MKLVNRSKYLIFRLQAYLAHLFLPKKSEKFRVVIFAQGRTGSTLLESLICSTRHFKKGGELLAEHGTKLVFPFQYLSGLAKLRPKNFIFHLKIYHLTKDRKEPIDPGSFLKRLHANGWKIIYLHRHNSLNHVLSNLIRDERGMAQKYDDKPDNILLNVDVEMFENRIEERIAYEQQERQVLDGLPILEVEYEEHLEDAANHQKTTDMIMSHFGLDHQPVSTRLKKINKLKTSERVANYDDLHAMLERRNWLKFID